MSLFDSPTIPPSSRPGLAALNTVAERWRSDSQRIHRPTGSWNSHVGQNSHARQRASRTPSRARPRAVTTAPMVRSAITSRITVAIGPSSPIRATASSGPATAGPKRLVAMTTSGTHVATARNIQKMKRQGRVPTRPAAM